MALRVEQLAKEFNVGMLRGMSLVDKQRVQ
jgi:hypothetical protein